MNDKIADDKRQVLIAPAPSSPDLPQGVINVKCGKDEQVEWIWTETLVGRFVSGFRIIRHEENGSQGA